MPHESVLATIMFMLLINDLGSSVIPDRYLNVLPDDTKRVIKEMRYRSFQKDIDISLPFGVGL